MVWTKINEPYDLHTKYKVNQGELKSTGLTLTLTLTLTLIKTE